MNEQEEVITVIGNLACCSLGVYIRYEKRHRTAGAARALLTTLTLETPEHTDGFLWQGPATPPESVCWLQKLVGAWGRL